MSAPVARAAALVAVLAVASLGLAGCLDSGFPATPTDAATTPGTPSGSPAPTPSSTPSATPSATPEAPTPVSVTCEQLVPLQPLYDLNPNYALVPTSSAANGTLAAAALADHGTVCHVVHTSSGATAVVSISQPGAAALAADQAAAGSSSTATDPSGGTTTTVYGSGSQLQAFTATLRFTAEGDSAFDPDDLASLLAIAVAAAD